MIFAVNFQFKQLEGRSLKNIRALTGFEPVTSAKVTEVVEVTGSNPVEVAKVMGSNPVET